MRTVFSAILPIILIITGVIIYFFYYKRRINAKLQGESGSSNHRIVSPWALAIILLAAFTIINTTRNRADLEAMRQQLTSLNYNISQMQQQLSELSESDRYRYDLNVSVDRFYLQEDSYYADVIIYVYPQTSRPDDRITLYLDDQAVEMTREPNRFRAVITKPTLQNYGECSLLIESDGRQYHEPLYLDGEKLYSNLFPFASFSGNSTFSKKKLTIDLHVWVPQAMIGAQLRDARMTVTDGGKVIDEIVITDTISEFDIRKTYSISAEKNITIQFVTVDDSGYRCVVNYLTPDATPACQVFDSQNRLVVQY